MIVFLIGARGSGKTTIGALLAQHMSFELSDTDSLVTERAGMTIADIVAKEGWEAFRVRESHALADACALPLQRKQTQGYRGTVIATGGGIILAAANRKRMAETGKVFYLAASAALLHQRLCASLDTDNRPSLTGKDPLQEIADVLQQREALYQEAAHHVISADQTPEQSAQEIARWLR